MPIALRHPALRFSGLLRPPAARQPPRPPCPTNDVCVTRPGGAGGWGAVPGGRRFSVRASGSRGAGGGGAGLPVEGERPSANVVREEMLQSYDLVERNGRGIVYLGSSRVPEDHPHFALAAELAAAAGELLGGVTTWSGIGAGMMEAVTSGAMRAGLPAAGLKISREGGDWVGLEASFEHPYLPRDAYLNCSFFSARKHGLVEAAVRREASDKTAFVGLPGGVGTLDEIFEVLTLIQLGRMGTEHPVPFLLMSYDGCFDALVEYLEKELAEYGSVGEGEVGSLWRVCHTNGEALAYLREFYGI